MLFSPWMEHTRFTNTLKRMFCGVPPSDLSRNMDIAHRGVLMNMRCKAVFTAEIPGGGGGHSLFESVGMRRGFAPHFRHLDDLFAPQNLTLSPILFRSCWVPFRSPPFSACRRSFCSQNWPNLSFYSDLVGSHFHPLNIRYRFSMSIGNTENHVATLTCLEWHTVKIC